MSRFFTLDESAEKLRISRPTLYRRLNDGTIPSVKIGGRRLVPSSFFEEFLSRVQYSISQKVVK